MKQYDVIIVGAGPGGLRCAEALAPSGLSILVLEKKPEIGFKVCAGGVTRKIFRVLDLPETMIEQKISAATLSSPGQTLNFQQEHPFVYTLDRMALGRWQADHLKDTQVEIRTGAQVTQIENDTVEVNRGEKIGYRYLVGADGPASLVRRYLKIPIKKRIVTFQYLIPRKGANRLEVFLDSRYFHSGYAWIFPHRDHLAVGCGVDPKKMAPAELKTHFHLRLKDKGFDITEAEFQSFPL